MKDEDDEGRRMGQAVDERTRALVRLSAALTGAETHQHVVMDAAAALDPGGAEEVLLQSHLFLGYPAALNALSLWRRRTGRPAPAPEPDAPDLWRRRGEAVCEEVYADHYRALRALMAQIHPDLDRWAVHDGYGKVLGRQGLDLRTRELCVAAQLAGSNATRQLHSHLRGCLNVGASPEEVEGMLDSIQDLIPEERARDARRVWDRVRTRWGAGEGE
jgi:4-carboxymuconolactone decarboxylase